MDPGPKKVRLASSHLATVWQIAARVQPKCHPMVLPHPPATILLLRLCEFVVGGLLYATIRPHQSPSPSSASASRHSADLKSQQHALLAGAAVDSLDLLITTWSWVVGSGNLTGGPAGVIAACAGTNLLIGFACIRSLPIAGQICVCIYI